MHLSVGIHLMFFSRLDWGYRFLREKATEVKWPFLSYRMKGSYSKYDLSPLIWTLITWMRLCLSVSHCKVTLVLELFCQGNLSLSSFIYIKMDSYLFYTLVYNPVMLCLFRCLNCSIFGHWELFQLAQLSF